jgi:hypothetical protein
VEQVSVVSSVGEGAIVGGARGRLRYAPPVLLGAFLLFLVQPLIARYILPWFGGGPSVWTTCMLFFQVALLLGYAYAHLLVSRWAPQTQALVHMALLVGSVGLLLVLGKRWGTPILPGAAWKPMDAEAPVRHIVVLLAVAVGLPYFVLATTSPLLQSWFSLANPGRSPYRLYTLSNVGSLAALLSYPFVVEPTLTVRAQAQAWTAAYLVFCAFCAYCGLDALRAARPGREEAGASDHAEPAEPTRPAWTTGLLWVALPALASVMLLAVTNELCQEVAVIPFLWVLPLSLYLLSFIICFAGDRWYSRGAFSLLLLLAVPLTAAILPRADELPMRVQILAHSVTLFVCCMVCHGELVALKPHPRYLTAFYLAVAVGGALGGVFVGVIAPVVFNWFWELLIGLVLCWLLGLQAAYRALPIQRRYLRLVAVMSLLVCGGLAGSKCLDMLHRRDECLLITRNFYGVLTILNEDANDPTQHRHTLLNGRIIHGYQFQAADRRQQPVSYYGPTSGVGLAVRCHPRRGAPTPEQQRLRIGVVGLGTATMAAWARPGDYVRFYEINPTVLALATDARYFTYLRDCPARWDVVLGDARLSLERELRSGPQQFDILVLDAFSSDAIPAHLLTQEAFAVYLAHLRDQNSILAVHVSNKVLDLRPVVWALAAHFGLASAAIYARGDDDLTYTSDWMLLTRNPEFLRWPPVAEHASPPESGQTLRLWTDDFHNLFQIMK